MTRFRRTYRDVDGQRVEGTWRPIFTRNGGRYFLDDLVVYADGAIDCGTAGLTDLDGLRAELRSGRLVTVPKDGAEASAHHLATWRFAEPRTWVDGEMLVGEVADEIDRLNCRPDSTGRCLLAVQSYLADPAEENRLAIRDRYLAIPEHLRRDALGDMDRKDAPLRILITELGEPVFGWPDLPAVTAEARAAAIDYFRQRSTAIAPPPGEPIQATVTLRNGYYGDRWPTGPGIHVLQNDFPATITFNGRLYATVSHGFAALSTSDPALHDRIAGAARASDAARLAERGPRRAGWSTVRLAVMAALMRAKYAQYPELAQTLRGTGDTRIVFVDLGDLYWIAGPQGSNWTSRLLELIRSELSFAATAQVNAVSQMKPGFPHR